MPSPSPLRTFRAVVHYRSGPSIAVSHSKSRIDAFVLETHGARPLPSDEYKAWQRRMPDEGGHPPVIDLD